MYKGSSRAFIQSQRSDHPKVASNILSFSANDFSVADTETPVLVSTAKVLISALQFVSFFFLLGALEKSYLSGVGQARK